MERSGGAPKMHIRTPNTVSGTCTEAETVQESLWNLNLLLSRCQLPYHAVPLEVVVVDLVIYRVCLCTPLLIVRIQCLEAIHQSGRYSLPPARSMIKSTGKMLFPCDFMLHGYLCLFEHLLSHVIKTFNVLLL